MNVAHAADFHQGLGEGFMGDRQPGKKHSHSQAKEPSDFTWGSMPPAPREPVKEKRQRTSALDADGVLRQGTGRVLRKEDSWRSRFYKHLCSAALAILSRHAVPESPRRDPVTHRVEWRPLWRLMSLDDLVVALRAYATEFASRHLDPEAASSRWDATVLCRAEMDRAIQNAAAFALDHWDPTEAVIARHRHERAVRGGRAHGARRPDVTVEMVAVHLDEVRHLTLAQAAAEMASWAWTTPTGRPVPKVHPDTIRSRLVELGFEGSGRTRVRQPTVHWSVLDDMDGMTNEQIAAEIGRSVRTVIRMKNARRAARADSNSARSSRIKN
ncbi:hypothetical protein [Curtobacterium sp. L1-20]|uniref:hypothetical protein n=1 Tax=Curtobacterium sp. L1-20 TaxID=3138181 RepID=UPI003B515980